MEPAIVAGASLEATHIARLQGRSIFKDIRVEAEDKINSKLISKIDEFIELANYDWVMSEPQGTSSSWLMDLIAFLNSVFLSFTNLPAKLARRTCMEALQHLAKSILKMLLADQVKAVSMGLVQQIDLDVVQCEQFAASEPVPGLQVRTSTCLLVAIKSTRFITNRPIGAHIPPLHGTRIIPAS
jgi:exocyst complex component 6